jgi:hypothetical protein
VTSYLFTVGHKVHCKHIFIIEVVVEEQDENNLAEDGAPTISIHALTGIQP